MDKKSKSGGNNQVTLTSQLHDAVKASSKKWHKDHVKAFFKSRLDNPLNDAAAGAVLSRVGALDGITMQNINGKNHIYNSLSSKARKCLIKFLYNKD